MAERLHSTGFDRENRYGKGRRAVYRDVGNQTLVREEELVGVFDLDITSQSYRTRAYLKKAEERGEVQYTDINELPKSFLVVARPCRREQKVVVSTLNPQSIARRLEEKP